MCSNNYIFRILSGRGYRIAVVTFFIVYLYLGVNIYKDYGVSWDEYICRDSGRYTFEYIASGNQEFLTHIDRYHGAIFEMLLTIVERILNPSNDMRSAYLLRHFFTFILFYIAVIAFYKLCKERFNSWKIGLLGSLFLIISPRIFAHSFYNSKDISFLSLFIVAIFTLNRLLKNTSLKMTFIHAFVCAFLIDIRLLGIIVPLFTVIFVAIEMLLVSNKELKIKRMLYFLAYLFLLVVFIIFFWPLLWTMPFSRFTEAFRQMKNYPWSNTALYLGNYIKATNLPWHYIPVWIVISTPPLYIICFLFGCCFIFLKLLRNPYLFYLNNRNDAVFLLWFFFPLAIIVLFRSVVYDEWRHLFFIYPALIIISLIGLEFLFRYLRMKFQRLKGQIIIPIFIFLIIANLLSAVYFMVKYHPFQNVYFNIFAGLNPQDIKNRFELDYWGLSYRQALEYILRNDTSKAIDVHVANQAGITAAYILPLSERKRLFYVDNLIDAKYFLSNYRWHREEYDYKDEYYSIKVNGLKIMVVYKMK